MEHSLTVWHAPSGTPCIIKWQNH